MTEYAQRVRTTNIKLAPGETKLFRLPPTTRGTILIKARTILPLPRGGGIGRSTRDRRIPAGGITVGTVRTDRDHREARDTPAGSGRPTVVDHRSIGIGRERLTDHRGIGFGDDLVLDPGFGPGSATPTDLKMELMLGTTLKQTHGSKLMLFSEYDGEVWQLRLTRENRGDTGERTYSIESYYPSVLPVLQREISIDAFQRAFDSNWNQNPYVTMEMRDEHFYITYDEEFRQLYGLENYIRDCDVPVFSIPDFTCSIRFSMAIERHPFEMNGVHDAPVMIVDANTSLPGVGITLKFFLGSFGTGAGFWPKAFVRFPDDDIPGVDIRAEIHDAVQGYLNKLPQAAFSKMMTPWLIGEPHRELIRIVGTSPTTFSVKWVGPRVPRSDVPEVLAETGPRPTEQPQTPPQYLYETPDETPPEGPREPLRPRRPYISSQGPLEVIQNVVVLMMENRSFDQVLGYLTRDEGRTDVDGLSPDDRNHWEEHPDNTVWVPTRAETTAWPSFEAPGPNHHHEGVVRQMSNNMGKFVANFDERAHGDTRLLKLIKAYFGPDQLPAYRALTEGFAICDAWFTPHAGPTWPNRFITFTGDLNLDHSGQPERENPHLDGLTPAQATTLFDVMTERGQSWRVYEHGYSFLRLYGRYTFETERVVDFRNGSRGFLADAAAGRLPRLSFIEPDYVDLPPGNDDHPPANMKDGQKLVATVVTALMDSPQWENTLLIITYDEHGGFYDHRVPPDGVPLAGSTVQRGPRVPAFVVSPWVAAGAVSKTVYDHTSIIATVLRTFCSPHPPKLSQRADSANDLRDLIQPTPRPRAEFNEIYTRLAAIRDQAQTPSDPRAGRLKANPDPDDFHSVMRYVRSFT